MRSKIRYFLILLLAAGALALFFWGRFPHWVEIYYSTFFFAKLRNFLHCLFSLFSWSAGECLYTLAFLYFSQKFYLFLKYGLQKKWTSAYLIFVSKKCLLLFLLLYVSFQLFWGLNYSRETISKKLNLPQGRGVYTSHQLMELDSLLLLKVNRYRGLIEYHGDTAHSIKEIIDRGIVSWRIAADKYPFLEGKSPVVKSSLYGWLGNYTGFTGYYNPFTGEAQVNTNIPSFLLPFVACHEMSHQLGFAKEAEANFAGYLIAKESPDDYVRYSAYLELFLYANRSLHATDSVSAKRHWNQLSAFVLQDLKVWKLFNNKYQNPIEPLVSKVYSFFLIQNKQPAGIESYGEVVDFLLAYYVKCKEV